VNSWPPWEESGIDEGIIDVPLSPHPTERLKWTVDIQNGKPSRTLWRVVDLVNPTMQAVHDDNSKSKKWKDPIRLELQPITGRTHQLRIHCAYINNGDGIIGDSLYGPRCVRFDYTGKFLTSHNNTKIPASPDQLSSLGQHPVTVASRLYLHARSLSFPYPAVSSAERRMEFVCDPDDGW
jgi:23S rRNA-/tRNA-specific pseudouridylate synthase